MWDVELVLIKFERFLIFRIRLKQVECSAFVSTRVGSS